MHLLKDCADNYVVPFHLSVSRQPYNRQTLSWWWQGEFSVTCWFDLNFGGWRATCVLLWAWTHVCILKWQQTGDSFVQGRHKKLMRYQCEATFKPMDFGEWNLPVNPMRCKGSPRSGVLQRNRNGCFSPRRLSNCLGLCSTEPSWRTGSLIRHSHPGLAPIGLPKESEGNAIV